MPGGGAPGGIPGIGAPGIGIPGAIDLGGPENFVKFPSTFLHTYIIYTIYIQAHYTIL